MKNIIIIFLSFYLTIDLFCQTEIPSLKISHLTSDFYVFTTYKTFKGKSMSSNGFYFLTDSGAVMIDTPWDTAQFQPLLDSIFLKQKKKVILCIATHSHEDRTAGLEFLRQNGVKTYASKLTNSICITQGEKTAEFIFVKDTTFIVGQYSFETYYGGEGHTKDNIVIWFNKDKILYAGCLVKSTEANDLGYVGESNIKEWPITLNNVKRKFPAPKFIITGHQDFRDIKSIEHTFNLLKDQK